MSPDTIWPNAVALVAAFVLAYAALHDIAARTIPQAAPAALAALGIVAALLRHGVPASLVAGTLALLLGLPLWQRSLLGGGDLKLLAAAMVLVPPTRAVPALLAIAIAGGISAAGYLLARAVLRRLPAATPRARTGLARRVLRAEAWRIRRGAPLPYGVAIAAGVAAILFER